MKKIILIGAGDVALNVIDLLLNEQKQFEPVGLIDIKKSKKKILGIPIIGEDNDLSIIKNKKIADYIFPAIGFGQNINNTLRKKIYENIIKYKFKIPNLISSKAHIRSGVKMGVGNLIQSGSVIDTNVILGNNINIGFNVCIGHGSKINNHVTIAGSVNINGNTSIGEGSFLGMNCSVFKDVGKWCKIAPNLAVLKKIQNKSIAYSNDIKILKL
mgnify:CR=1 FL=1|tara:strand:- start:175 stop:816 length:642 start_codon:yes stop_codon:yes gene_type:complete